MGSLKAMHFIMLLLLMGIPFDAISRQDGMGIAKTSNLDLVIPQDSLSLVDRDKIHSFIKQIHPSALAVSNFILVDKPFAFESFGCLDPFLDDSAFYTKAELDFIMKSIKTSSIKWSNGLLGSVNVISKDTIDAIFKDKSKGWNYFYKHFGQSYYIFSLPIFLRNDTLCLFYSSTHCGYECGDGHFKLYEKEYGKWIEVKTYCNWIS